MASSSLILSPPHPMEKIRGNCDSSPILSCSSSTSREATGCPTEERRRGVPWLMLPPESSFYNFYRVAEGDVLQVEQRQEPEADSRCLGLAFPGWLAYIQRKDCQVFLFNPLSGHSIKLPPVETLPSIAGVVRNSHSGLIESFLDYESYPLTSHCMSKYIISKVVLSSSPMDDDCIAVAVYGHLDRLAFCRWPLPGDDDANSWSWTALHGPLNGYTRMVFDSRKKLFFAFTDAKELEAWDLHNDPIKRFPIHSEDFSTDLWPIAYMDDADLERKRSYCIDDGYLVYDHQSQELFVVTRYTALGIHPDGSLIPQSDDYKQFPYKTQTFDVFRLDFIDHDHVKLHGLEEGDIGNRAFFIGSNPGFALSTTKYPELRPNSIYFTDDGKFMRRPNCGGHDLGIYDYKNRCFSPCYYPIDLDKIQPIQPNPLWFTPDVDAEFLA